ncbi:MAG: CBASS oligonucleotide cyclase [Candidatus Rokuibacteriota bacterium]
MSIKGRFDRFTNKIRPTDDHIAEANRQTDYMKGRLHDTIVEDGSFKLEKILLAGSNAKHTSLRKTRENRFDVDLNAVYSGEGARKDALDKLLYFTRDRLVEIYHQKEEKDFEVLKSAVRVKFTSGIQLWVDVAPIIKDDSLSVENAGWIPRPDGTWRLTSVTAHSEFVLSRTQASKKVPGPVRFNRLVRLLKWWNNLQGDLTQPSIFCELVAAAAVRKAGRVTEEWQTAIRQVFTFLRRQGLREPIVFDDNYDPQKVSLATGTVVVLDPVNPENNVTAAWTERTRTDFLDRVQDAYDASIAAWSAEVDDDEDEAVDHWCELFGDAFRTLSDEED